MWQHLGWQHLGSSVVSEMIWQHLGTPGSIWEHLEASGSNWQHLGWQHLAPCGAIWRQLALSGTSGTIWHRLAPSGLSAERSEPWDPDIEKNYPRVTLTRCLFATWAEPLVLDSWCHIPGLLFLV